MVKPAIVLLSIKRSLMALCTRSRVPKITAANNALMCLWQDDQRLHVVEILRNGRDKMINRSTLSGSTVRRPLVVILPKSQYLVKNVEVPIVAPQELAVMLRLEAEASLPPEFGPAEVSYFRLSHKASHEGRAKYEVYIARDDVLRKLLEALRAVNSYPDAILPSTVAWRGVLSSRQDAGMLVVELPGGIIETAIGQDSVGCHVRTIESNDNGHAMAPGVVESIRFLMASGESGGHHTVLWCGQSRPKHNIGVVRFEDATQEGQLDADAAALALAWHGLGRLSNGELQTSALSPRSQEEARRKITVRNLIMTSVLAIAAALLMINTSLLMLSARYRSAEAELDKKIATIRREGETIESHIKQISAVAAASDRQDEFQQLLNALYEHTPPGISYSEIAMDEGGRVRLHGQAVSMGQPFMLPSALEGKGRLSRVVVKSAGLSRTGGSAITEFRAELALRLDSR